MSSRTTAATRAGDAASTHRSSASSIAPAVAKRSSGFRSSAHMTTASRPAASATSVLGAGICPQSTSTSISTPLPLRMRSPVRSSQTIAPAPYTSARRSQRPVSCSGARYRSLPLIAPCSVWCWRDAADATPKSVMRAAPSKPTSTFCGETSRCTTFSASPSVRRVSWAAWRPASTSRAIAATTSTGRRRPRCADARTSAPRSTPSTHSITSAGSSPPTNSMTPITFG